MRSALSLSLALLIIVSLRSETRGDDSARIARLPEIVGPANAKPSAGSETASGPLFEPVPAEVEAAPPEDVAYWYEPVYWFPPDLWDASFEAGVNGTEGNSEALSTRLGGKLERKTDRGVLDLDIVFNRAKTGSVETQNNALGTARYDWLFGESPWTLFAVGMAEYDEFRAFDLRLAANGGVGYEFLKTETTKLVGRIGSGVSREFDSPDEDTKPEAVFGADFAHQLSKKQSLKLKIDYFPDWTDFTDYRLQANFGWEILLDAETDLSLKLGIIDRYDSTPGNRRPNDVDYSLLLLWKL